MTARERASVRWFMDVGYIPKQNTRVEQSGSGVDPRIGMPTPREFSGEPCKPFGYPTSTTVDHMLSATVAGLIFRAKGAGEET